MARRSYGQYCAVARALDVVGDRWSLLLVRELVTGPKRFKDLLGGLRGIGANLLTARLRELEEEGLVRRATLPPPAGSAVYELTELGRGLEPALLELARWGARFLGPRDPDQLWQPYWCAVALKAIFRPERARGVRETYELHVDGETFHARVRDGALETERGPASAPDLVLTTGSSTLFALVSGRLEPRQALRNGALRIEGEVEALERCFSMFRFSAGETPA